MNNGTRLPLEGIRVADFSQVWSGPYLTKTLGDWGAQVVKIESLVRYDTERGPTKVKSSKDSGAVVGGYPKAAPGSRPYNQRGRFVEYNRNKLSLVLDLTTTAGVEQAKALVAISDVVVENYSVGVMGRFGLDYANLRKVRPDLVMISMPGFGSTGPEAPYRGYGPTQEALSGLSSITSYPGEAPMETGVFYADPTIGLFGSMAVMTALWYRQRTGKGQHLDLAQREGMIHILPDLVLEYQMTGRIVESLGNRHAYMAPHGCYPCAGQDSWLVISCASDEMWKKLCEAMGREDLACDPRLKTLPGRKQNEDELDKVIADWTRQHDHYEAMHLLQAHGVAAEAVLKGTELFKDPHYAARGYFEMSEVPDAGPYPTHGMSWKLSRTQGKVRLPSPRLGEHNAFVLKDILGVSDERVRELEAAKVTGTDPTFTTV